LAYYLALWEEIGLAMQPMKQTLRNYFHIQLLAITALLATAGLGPSVSYAQMDKVKVSMAALKDKSAKLGAPQIKGRDVVGGMDAPVLYFGNTKMNNFFDVVDQVVKENGGTATLFVRTGADFVRVATNVRRADGSRAVGTVLDPTGPAYAAIRKGMVYYGNAVILGKLYVTGYEPIRDESGAVVGIYYTGYLI
jgi:hypothetical protein